MYGGVVKSIGFRRRCFRLRTRAVNNTTRCITRVNSGMLLFSPVGRTFHVNNDRCLSIDLSVDRSTRVRRDYCAYMYCDYSIFFSCWNYTHKNSSSAVGQQTCLVVTLHVQGGNKSANMFSIRNKRNYSLFIYFHNYDRLYCGRTGCSRSNRFRKP